MEEKETYLESSIYEQNKLVQQYRKAADDKKNIQRRKLSLANQIRKKEEDLLLVEKEMGELTKY
jgi:hypothetical protein